MVDTILAKSLGTLWYFPIQKCIRVTKHLTVHPDDAHDATIFINS